MVMLSKVAVSTTTSILEVSRGGRFAANMWSCLSASLGGEQVGCWLLALANRLYLR